MKERKGPFGLMVGGLVDSVVQTARRRAQDREPRVLFYDGAGLSRTLPPGSDGREAVLATAARLIELVPAARRDVPADEEAGEAVTRAADEADAEARAEAEMQADAEAAGADDHPGEARP